MQNAINLLFIRNLIPLKLSSISENVLVIGGLVLENSEDLTRAKVTLYAIHGDLTTKDLSQCHVTEFLDILPFRLETVGVNVVFPELKFIYIRTR